MNNPHEAVRPDFDAEAHELDRQALIATGLTVEQARQALDSLWTLNNERERVEWDQRRAEAAQAEAAAAQEAARVEEERIREEQEAEVLAHCEDKKKHKAKYAKIPDLSVPSEANIFPSPFAIRRLEKGEFVDLFYFTNRGLEEAEKAGLEDETFVLVQDGDAQSWVPSTAARNRKEGVTKDDDLTWEEFLEAAPRAINFMSIAGWPEDHVRMFVEFWSNLQKHEWRFSSDRFSKRALLVYQGQQRRRWHLTIGTGRGWSLAQINQDILVKTRDNLFTQARNSELAKLTKVCILLHGSSSTLTVFLLSLLFFSPPLPDLLSLSPIARWDHDDWDNTTR